MKSSKGMLKAQLVVPVQSLILTSGTPSPSCIDKTMAQQKGNQALITKLFGGWVMVAQNFYPRGRSKGSL